MSAEHEPTVEQVLARLRGGERAQFGAGRYYKTFFFEGAALKVQVFDEGHVDTFDSKEEELTSSLKSEGVTFSRL